MTETRETTKPNAALIDMNKTDCLRKDNSRLKSNDIEPNLSFSIQKALNLS